MKHGFWSRRRVAIIAAMLAVAAVVTAGVVAWQTHLFIDWRATKSRSETTGAGSPRNPADGQPGPRMVFAVAPAASGSASSQGDSSSPAEAMIRAIRARVDPTGGRHLKWRAVGADRFEVTIPADAPDAGKLRQELLAATEPWVLEFHVAATQGDFTADKISRCRQALASRPPVLTFADCQWQPVRVPLWGKRVPIPFLSAGLVAATQADSAYFLVHTAPARSMTGQGEGKWQVRQASPAFTGLRGMVDVQFRLDRPGESRFEELTGRNVRRLLCTLLDGTIIGVQTITAKSPQSNPIGGLSAEEAARLSSKLQAGPLPMTVTLVE